jgi:dCMP deaminase
MTDKAHKWDYRFMDLCDHIASWSEDPSRKVGAVIVGDENTIIATGYNGLPRGVSDEVEARFDRKDGYKYHWVEHAERNAIFNASRSGVSTNKTRLYCTLFPCSDCARAIIQSGINELVSKSIPKDETRFAVSMAISIEMLEEAGVLVRFLD